MSNSTTEGEDGSEVVATHKFILKSGPGFPAYSQALIDC